ncbi:MAG: phycobilisome rod-core linker polypeptide [Cyanobacteria bacterium P01_H01_bin.121]
MPLPLINYPLTSRNHRVAGYEVPGDEYPYIFSTENLLDASDLDVLIRAAYRQVFNEQQMLKSNRQVGLESQLRNGQINVREFIRGLATSDTFRRRNYDVSNNYRVVQMCVQRILGREVYDDRETLAWSIVLATKGLNGFIDALLGSDEYLENFGDDTVPYQRRRILPQRAMGELPFARMPRYGADYRETLMALGYFKDRTKFTIAGPRWDWQKPPYPPLVTKVGAGITYFGAAFVTFLFVASALAAFGIVSL